MGKSVVQEWVGELTMMQQTVLLTCIRGPDGMAKYSSPKYVARWFRRCVVLSAIDGKVLDSPILLGGGSFTGPSIPIDETSFTMEAMEELFAASMFPWEDSMVKVVDNFVRDEDCIPAHYMAHIRHGAEILGYKHPDERIRKWWNQFYLRLVNLLHLHPESEAELDLRLGDTLEGWQARGDAATER